MYTAPSSRINGGGGGDSLLGQGKGVSPVADGGNSERTQHSLGTGSKSSDGCVRRFLGSN